MNDRLELLKKYRANFEGTKGTVSEVSAQINALRKIWQTVGYIVAVRRSNTEPPLGDPLGHARPQC